MDPYDAGPDALNDNVNADDRDDDRFLFYGEMEYVPGV